MMSHAFFISLFLFLPPLFLLLGIKRANSKNHLNLPPSPPKLPIIGNLHQLSSLPHRSLRDLSNKYGPLMLLRLGQVPTLVVSSPGMAQQVMKTHDLVFASRPRLKTVSHIYGGSDGISFAPYGEYWRQARKLCVTHLLGTKMVQSFRNAVEREVEWMIEKIPAELSSSSTRTVDVSDMLNWFAGNVMSRAISANTSAKEGRKHVMRLLADETSKVLGEFQPGDFFPMIGWMDIFGLDGKGKRVGKGWNDLLDEIIDEHDANDDGNNNTDLVDVLLTLERDPANEFSFTREDIKAILIDMFAAGVDTSHTVLEWSMAELVRNPKVMKKLQHEVRGAARGKYLVRGEEIGGMNYLKAVIKETMRLHTPVPLLLPRESSKNCEVGGYQVPKKTRIVVNAWAIARDPNIWEEPEEFKPERFLSGSVDFKGKDFEYIPFGAGRRICPGINFAVQTVELGLANLVHRFDWELPGNMAIEDLDMTDASALVVHKKQRLELVAKFSADSQ